MSVLSNFISAFKNFARQQISPLNITPKPVSALLSDRERWMLWAAIRNGSEIRTYTGVQHVHGGAIIVIGPYSSERLRTLGSMQEDFAALRQLEQRGYIEHRSKTKWIVTDAGRSRAPSF